jgi:hypothetical protein
VVAHKPLSAFHNVLQSSIDPRIDGDRCRRDGKQTENRNRGNAQTQGMTTFCHFEPIKHYRISTQARQFTENQP